MKHTRKYTLATGCMIALLTWASTAQACKVLRDIQPAQSVKVSAQDILKCAESGEDAPFNFRPKSGMDLSNTPTAGGSLQMQGCGVDGTCTNAARERVTNFVAGADPANNPNLNIPDISWKDMTVPQIPCGGVSALTEMALQTLWGNVSLNLPPAAMTLLNNALNGLIGNLFQKTDCSDGTFWGVLNNALNVILPGLNGNQNNGFVYNVENSTFLSPSGTLLVLPQGATFYVDLSMGGANFNLPAGGQFTAANGTIVNIASGSSVQFNSNGNVVLGSGQTYQVPAMSVVNFDPHGAVSIPPGSVVPVPPDAPLFPMAPKTTPPAWAKNA